MCWTQGSASVSVMISGVLPTVVSGPLLMLQVLYSDKYLQALDNNLWPVIAKISQILIILIKMIMPYVTNLIRSRPGKSKGCPMFKLAFTITLFNYYRKYVEYHKNKTSKEIRSYCKQRLSHSGSAADLGFPHSNIYSKHMHLH